VRLKFLSSVLVSASLIASPALAAPAASASKLSVVGARSGASMAGENELGSGAGGILALALVAGIAAILIVGELANDNDDDPVSG
jgi:hypothetical protein